MKHRAPTRRSRRPVAYYSDSWPVVARCHVHDLELQAKGHVFRGDRVEGRSPLPPLSLGRGIGSSLLALLLALEHDVRRRLELLPCCDSGARAALIAPRVASFIHRLLSLAATSPRAHALELLHATSRLTAACPRVGTVLQPDADDAVGAAVADLEDPDGPLALQSAAWQLPALRRHYHPAIARGARDICTQPPRGGS